MTGITISGLVAGYGRSEVLGGATLEVASGELLCVLGTSGCGKTTMLRVIAGFESAWSGSVRIGDRVVDDGSRRLPAERRRVGYVAQDSSLFPHLDVAKNVGFGIDGTSRVERRATVSRYLDLLQLSEFASRLPHQLSGGQQQRVAIARALASNPHVVLLDEPFASLDAILRATLRQEVRDVLGSSGVTGMLVTHDRSEALSLGDRVAVLRDGIVVQVATPRELYMHPVDVGVATFVGDAAVVEATVADGVALTPIGALRADPSSPLREGRGYAVIRPEQLRLRRLDTPPTAGVVAGQVARSDYFGHDARVDVTVRNGADFVRVVARVADGSALMAADTVAVTVEQPVWLLTA